MNSDTHTLLDTFPNVTSLSPFAYYYTFPAAPSATYSEMAKAQSAVNIRDYTDTHSYNMAIRETVLANRREEERKFRQAAGEATTAKIRQWERQTGRIYR